MVVPCPAFSSVLISRIPVPRAESCFTERVAYGSLVAATNSTGLGVNAGHDLDLANLIVFRDLPFLDEVSIGHALMSRALFVGLPAVVAEYLAVLSPAAAPRG